MQKISPLQFSLTLIIYILGSAILFPLGIEAEHDAYIVMLLGMLIGIIMSLMYSKLSLISSPSKNFVSVLLNIFGKFFGSIIGFIFSTWLFWVGIRNFRDLAEQVMQNLLPTAKLISILIPITIITIYALYQGLEVIIRISVMIFPFVIFTLLFINIYLMASASDFNNLQPVLSTDINVIKDTIFPGIIVFPFSETSNMMMIIPLISGNKREIKKHFIIAIVVSSLLLTMNTVMMISVLGATLAATVSFPLLVSTQLGGFHFDFFTALIMVLTLTIKIFLFIYGGIEGYRVLFPISYKTLSLTIPPIAGILSFFIAKGYPQHVEVGLGLSIQIGVWVGIYLPLATLVFYYLKKGIKKIKN